MGLVGSIKVGDKIFREDMNPDNVYHIKNDAQDRANDLRRQGYLVRIRFTLCTEGTEEAWQIFKWGPGGNQ